MGKKILVTGGLGYIGSHTVVELLNQNYDVIIVDNLSNSYLSVLEGIAKITNKRPTLYIKDLGDKTSVDNIFRVEKNIDAVIHFAAYKSVGESVKSPLKYYENNILSLINVLSACSEFNVKKLVFSSSCTVYGQPDQLPVSEKTEIKNATSPYGNTKQISEEIIKDLINSNSQIKIISLRYFNPIGAHPSGNIGELPIGIPDNLVPYITQTILGIRDELKIFGNDYNTEDGTCIRDYIDVTDLSKAHIKALDYLNTNNMTDSYELFNIGTGSGTSVLKLIQTFEKVINNKIKYRIAERRLGDIEKIWADCTKANNILKWKSTVPLEETLRSAWVWEQNFRNS